jgi:Ca2+-transporting ATPase
MVMKYHTKTVHEALEELQTSEHGLSASEASERLKEYGPNVLRLKGEPFWKKLVEPFANVFMLVLFVAAAVSLWHHESIDALIIVGIMLTNAAIYYAQRFSTERILRALQKHDRLLVDVLRDGKPARLDASLLVPGDVIILDEGEKLPADCRLLSVSSLRVDESQLTGESLPVEKQIEPVTDDSELYERSNMVYQGSFVVGGQARALIIATGNTTEFGKLAALSVATDETSPVQKRIDKLINALIRIIAAVAAAAFVLSLYRGMDVGEAIRYVLALSVSAVPESLPVAITVVLVLGMRRMAKKKALVKNTSAIETVGTVTVIASDKTGTLTKNQLTVQKLWSVGGDNKKVLLALAHAVNGRISKTQDPLDEAIERHLGAAYSGRAPRPLAVLPFEQTLAMSGNLYHNGSAYDLYVKGAPEHILDRCKLDATAEEKVAAEIHSLAGSGFRVIALAHASLKRPFEALVDMPPSTKFSFDGLVAVADILRPEAAGAIKKAREAGVKVYMVTGDHFETAFHIARELGIVEHPDEVFDSRRMQGLSDEKLAKIIESTRVFARVIPENKHRLLAILNKTQITAMTGDGVNDVPALANAHVGLAMGSGTSIAKDAGDIILLDNNFRSIVEAVHEGRTVYANIKRMVAYLLSTNGGEVLVALSSLVAGIPVPIVPVQILWINLVTDTCMVIPIGLEPGERRNMLVSPKPANAPLFSKFFLTRIITTALTMAILTLVIYTTYLSSHGLDYARTIAFHALVVMQWASAFNSRSDYESLWTRIRRFSPAFYIGLAAAITLQVIALSGVMHTFLHLSVVSLRDILIITAIAFLVPILVIELHKWIGRAFFNKGSANVHRNLKRTLQK